MFDYRARLVRVVDADTIVLELDCGFGGRQEEQIRLLDVSAPELRDPGGAESHAFTVQWLSRLSARRWPLWVDTEPSVSVEPVERRSFVRYLATVRDYTDPEHSLNEALAGFLAEHPEWGSGM